MSDSAFTLLLAVFSLAMNLVIAVIVGGLLPWMLRNNKSISGVDKKLARLKAVVDERSQQEAVINATCKRLRKVEVELARLAATTKAEE